MPEAISRRNLFNRNFRPLREAVRAALADADPIRLFELGAPVDEYDPEVAAIVSRLSDARTIEAVRAVVHGEFARRFGDDIAGPLEKYDQASAAIWRAMKEAR